MEPIKQEIINNIFENGDKLITGPILQTVLIDMIDDVNVKDQEILSKTGSWDDAVTQIPNLATKAEVTNLSESVARDLENVDLTGYATEQWVQDQGYLKEHQDISGLATKTELTTAENSLQGNITSLSESVARDLANVSVPEGVATEAWVQSQDYASKSYVDNAVSSSSVDLTGYATETWVQNQGYLKEHQDISNLATKAELTSVSESVQTDISNLATKTELTEAENSLQGNITSLSESVARDLTGYATETWVQSQGYLKEHQDISNLATKSELTSVSESVRTDITNLSESVANSAVWKKGTGTDSVVQAIADGTDLPTAAGERAIATGLRTVAGGNYSHAEGFLAEAPGLYSHAEGYGGFATGNGSHTEGYFARASKVGSHAEGRFTEASGDYSHAEGSGSNASGEGSHAEGYFTTASNNYEHAQGQYNHSSTNQIFSVGAGEKIGETVTRRNAVSILEVPNADTQVVTASFFVQNIGGYDGTNPEPGTNDLATVINNLPSGGGSSETLWKKGTGTDSIVQILTGGNEAYTPTATGAGAIATGYATTASGYYSHAEGNQTTARDYGHAEGYQTTASSGHAEGRNTYTSNNGHAEGYGTRAKGQDCHAEGLYSTASGYYTHAEGQNTFTSEYCSHAEGLHTSASGAYSHVEGQSTKTLGRGSHAEGYGTIASGSWSHAEGQNTRASGDASHAEGDSTLALRYYSHAEGYRTTASKEGSHAEGESTIASGSYSHAEGGYTLTSNQYEHAQGRYNHSSTNQIFSIGTGNSNTDRRNAVSVLEVSNNDSYTSSLFVQNIGGYDGTNPEPGTNDLATVINGMSTGGGSSETLWKKGEGKDSAVLILTGNDEANTSTATGVGAIALGFATTASGQASYAEGGRTIASGHFSHAEGYGTVASNLFEHAQGMLNDSSENQIFSVGAGDGDASNPPTVTRRNAISVLAVKNNDSYTASFFVQNVGGYDGTNPTPGTNDLATVINGMAIEGGIGTSSETWTFTLEDGSTVTKNIVMR